MAGAGEAGRSGWTAERVERLRRLARRGLSASQIAVELGGVSRDAVIGKCRTEHIPLGAGRRKPSPRPKPKPEAKREPEPEPKPKPAARPPIADPAPLEPPFVALAEAARAEASSAGISIGELKGQHCRWPLWRDGTPDGARLYCGARKDDAAFQHPYCAAHQAVARGATRVSAEADTAERGASLERAAS